MKKDRLKTGFTLIEVMSASAILAVVLAAAALAYTMSIRIWRLSSARIDASSSASLALTRCTMGVGSGFGLRTAFRPVNITSSTSGWQIGFITPASMSGDGRATNSLAFDAASRTISYQSGNATPTVIGRNIVDSQVTSQSDRITITVRAQATTGYTNITSEMSTSITPRNRS